MVRKITGIEELVNSVVDRLGNLEAAYLIGGYARGADIGIIDVVLVGDIDRTQLDDLVAKTEACIDRKIRSLVVTAREFDALKGNKRFTPMLKLWEAGNGKPGSEKVAAVSRKLKKRDDRPGSLAGRRRIKGKLSTSGEGGIAPHPLKFR